MGKTPQSAVQSSSYPVHPCILIGQYRAIWSWSWASQSIGNHGQHSDNEKQEVTRCECHSHGGLQILFAISAESTNYLVVSRTLKLFPNTRQRLIYSLNRRMASRLDMRTTGVTLTGIATKLCNCSAKSLCWCSGHAPLSAVFVTWQVVLIRCLNYIEF